MIAQGKELWKIIRRGGRGGKHHNLQVCAAAACVMSGRGCTGGGLRGMQRAARHALKYACVNARRGSVIETKDGDEGYPHLQLSCAFCVRKSSGRQAAQWLRVQAKSTLPSAVGGGGGG